MAKAYKISKEIVYEAYNKLRQIKEPLALTKKSLRNLMDNREEIFTKYGIT